MYKIIYTITCLSVCVLFVVGSAQAIADWKSDPQQSSIHFVSVKKGSIAEVNRFKEFSAKIDSAGQLVVSINLDSVNTAVEIRDQRMREFLFETARFPTATLTADVSSVSINDLPLAMPYMHHLDAVLSLHGMEQNLTAHLTVIKLDENTIMVSSAQPIVINAADYSLVEGVQKLADLVGGIDIATAVPVVFQMTFRLE